MKRYAQVSIKAQLPPRFLNELKDGVTQRNLFIYLINVRSFDDYKVIASSKFLHCTIQNSKGEVNTENYQFTGAVSHSINPINHHISLSGALF